MADGGISNHLKHYSTVYMGEQQTHVNVGNSDLAFYRGTRDEFEEEEVEFHGKAQEHVPLPGMT